MKNTGVYFKVKSKFYLKVAVILLSHLGHITVETSIWFKEGEICVGRIQEDIVEEILSIRDGISEQLKARGIEPTADFDLLCPNCNKDNHPEHLVTLTEYNDKNTGVPSFRIDKKMCVKREAYWELSTYKGTRFGKHITF